MNRNAGGIVGLVEAVVDRLHHHLSGVQPDPDLQAGVAQPGNRGVHGQRGQASAHGVIFVRTRRPEQRHDAVALHLVDQPVVAMNRIAHGIEHRLDPAHRAFGVHARDQAGGIPYVGEQHGEPLVLAAAGAQRAKHLA